MPPVMPAHLVFQFSINKISRFLKNFRLSIRYHLSPFLFIYTKISKRFRDFLIELTFQAQSFSFFVEFVDTRDSSHLDLQYLNHPLQFSF